MNDTKGVPQTVPIPPNIDTVNALFGTSLDTEEDMVAWLDDRRPKSEKPPANGEEMSISRVKLNFVQFLISLLTSKVIQVSDRNSYKKFSMFLISPHIKSYLGWHRPVRKDFQAIHKEAVGQMAEVNPAFLKENKTFHF